MRPYLGEPSSEHVMLRSFPEGLPSENIPDQMSLERRWYLFKEIREFCDERFMDLVCPEPASALGMHFREIKVIYIRRKLIFMILFYDVMRKAISLS